MHKLIAGVYSHLLTVLNLIVILALISYLYVTYQSLQYAPQSFIFALLAFVIYIMVVGLFSVVISMHQELTEIKNLMQKYVKQKEEKEEKEQNRVLNIADGKQEPKLQL